MDSIDTVDLAIHHLSHLQAEGWALEEMDQIVDYSTGGDRLHPIPIATTMIIKLRPA